MAERSRKRPVWPRRILCAIEFPGEADQAGLDKAVALARVSGAALTLFHAASDPEVDAGPAGERRARRAYVLRLRRDQLRGLAATTQLPAARVATRVTWATRADRAVLSAARAQDADLIVGQSTHRGLERWLLRFNDWLLIRGTPVPLLLVKSAARLEAAPMVAAVDPFHAQARPADLDVRILAQAEALRALTGGKLEIYHAADALEMLVGSGPGVRPRMRRASNAEQERRTAWIRHRLVALARRARLGGRAAITVDQGRIVETLPAHLARRRAGVLVVGAVSRSFLQRLVIGATAEQLLDRVECDLLIVPGRRD